MLLLRAECLLLGTVGVRHRRRCSNMIIYKEQCSNRVICERWCSNRVIHKRWRFNRVIHKRRCSNSVIRCFTQYIDTIFDHTGAPPQDMAITALAMVPVQL